LSGAAALALVASATPALASRGDPALTYLQARAAIMDGQHARAAQLLADLSAAQPDQVQFAQQALTEAIGSGRMDLAGRLVAKVPADKLSTDARLLMAVNAIKQHRPDVAIAWLGNSDPGGLGFLAPLIRAWDAAERGDQARAVSAIAAIPPNGILSPLRNEEMALVLLKLGKSAQADPFASQAVGSAGSREDRLRLSLADGFLASGDRVRAASMIQGIGIGYASAKQRILAGRPSGEAIDSGAKAFAVVLASLATDVMRLQRGAVPIGLVQIAHYADPQNSSITGLLALLLDGQDRTAEALALLNAVPADDALISQMRDAQAQILVRNKRANEALTIAATAVKQPGAGVADYSRYGDVLEALDRHDEAADAFARAVAAGKASGLGKELWTLELLQASALEEGNRWPEAKAVLQQALAIAPEQPLLLNFLGYAKLERGEDVQAAEAMIRKASQLAPDDASITDSLGWAQFKLGRVDEAIATLQTAAEKDPVQADIHEHLGDALYKSGRRLEARFAWNAALVTAEDKVAERVKAKLASGLTSANAAP
jgi:tetratricopeptide (TPR) repeat protein